MSFRKRSVWNDVMAVSLFVYPAGSSTVTHRDEDANSKYHELSAKSVRSTVIACCFLYDSVTLHSHSFFVVVVVVVCVWLSSRDVDKKKMKALEQPGLFSSSGTLCSLRAYSRFLRFFFMIVLDANENEYSLTSLACMLCKKRSVSLFLFFMAEEMDTTFNAENFESSENREENSVRVAARSRHQDKAVILIFATSSPLI